MLTIGRLVLTIVFSATRRSFSVVHRELQVVGLFQHLHLGGGAVNLGLVLTGNLLQKVVGVDDAVGEFRLCRLAYLTAERYEVIVLGDELAVHSTALVLLNLEQRVVEEEGLAARLDEVALGLNLPLVGLVAVESVDVPDEAGTNHAVQFPVHPVRHGVSRP